MNDGTNSGADILNGLEISLGAQCTFQVVGIVGAAGAGTSWTARILVRLLKRRNVSATIIKARDCLKKALGDVWIKAVDLGKTDPVHSAHELQKLGNNLRRDHDDAIVASAMIAAIADFLAGDNPPHVFICDSLRHPAEAKLLRMVYGDAFWTLGTVCDLDTRRDRLKKKFTIPQLREPVEADLEKFIERDQDDASDKHGQHVAEAFELADYFVDTSASLSDPDAPDTELDEWPVAADLGRFLDLVRGDRNMLRPTDAERAMYHAYAARLGSACLSRQVGAALIDKDGQLISTGCNEVPRAGGGLYGQGEGENKERERGRCHSMNGYCSNTIQRNEIIEDIISVLDQNGSKNIDVDDREELVKKLRKSRIGQLVEFSRSVHAEMDAVVSAARKGVSTVGSRLFVTTFPCHNCARHIVAAGIDEVQFIEPYLKSKALLLHADSITQKYYGWVSPSKARALGQEGPYYVLFRPYVGVAPRLYRRAFVKDGEVKDGTTGFLLRDQKPAYMRLRPLSNGVENLQNSIRDKFNSIFKT
ncbi:anti-phage dCTP deaminase [Nitrospirillum sp. BR 11828]|uniref:anti-phage dCTP deaminase n=1 Tax=Nitrospirillum sp. BR 11828 TaxID=3104325 RepID=UPI002ACA8BCD|nr:anti-phage dCTP deaminase [Nitrospirillum sp. BR 11828]MDZ5649561.1 anti-phage dCTP deaminase [Nitrospirillum sp. BR 11828]